MCINQQVSQSTDAVYGQIRLREGTEVLNEVFL